MERNHAKTDIILIQNMYQNKRKQLLFSHLEAIDVSLLYLEQDFI